MAESSTESAGMVITSLIEFEVKIESVLIGLEGRLSVLQDNRESGRRLLTREDLWEGSLLWILVVDP